MSATARQRLRPSGTAVASGCTIRLYHRVKLQSKKRLKYNMLTKWWAL